MPLRKRKGVWYWRQWLNGREYSGSTKLAATRQNMTAARRFAEEKRAEILAEVTRQAPENRLFEDAAAEFLTWCEDVEYRAKPNTAERIASSFATLRAFFARRAVAGIIAADVEAFKAWRVRTHHVRDVTIRHDLYALSVFYRKYALRQGLAESNPVTAVTKPSDRDAIRIYVVTPEEEAAYFAEAARHNSALYDVARLILLTGCRPGEIVRLRPDDVDLGRQELYIRAGKSRAARRTLYLTAEALEILRRRKNGAHWWLFPSVRYGPSKHIVRLNDTHKQVCQAAGLSIVLYDFRHTFATRMVEAGCDLPALAAILGHAGLTMVMRYVHPTRAHQAAAMARYQEKFGGPQQPRKKEAS